MKCDYHPEREAFVKCTDCGKEICNLCLTATAFKIKASQNVISAVPLANKHYCSSCIDKIIQKSTERSPNLNKEPVTVNNNPIKEDLATEISRQETAAATLPHTGEGFMPRPLPGFDWRKSNAYLLLLSKFLHHTTVDYFAESYHTWAWNTVLGEAPQQAIKRFLDEGMLVQADLSAQLDCKFKVTELKDMLKKRALAVSGRKGDLIQRLVQADPEAMKQVVAGLTVIICSEQGREIAEQYVASEKAKRSKVEQQIMEYLRQRKFKEAGITVASYEADQVFGDKVFSGGISIVDWKHYNPARDIETLNIIFSGKPRILVSLSDSHLDKLRFAAGMMHLWRTNRCKEWLPPNFETGLAMDNDTAARMFLFYASHQINIADYRQMGVEQAEISTAQDSCSACEKIAGKKYKLNEVPELPYEHCTHQMGCRCGWVAVVERYSI